MSLQNMQAEFAEAILSKTNVPGTQPSENMIIYRNNVFSSFKETLKETYPMVVKLVGEPFFNLTIKEYIKRYPSRSSNLHEYGEYFSDFLAQYQPVKNLLYLSEVAHFEWLCHTLFFASDHPGFDINSLKKFSPEQHEQLRFTLHPASKLQKFHFPILRIIDLCTTDINETIDIDEGGVNLLIIRRDLDVSLVPLTTGEFIFLSTLDAGKTLTEALELAIRDDPSFKLDEKLPSWIKDKTLVECDLKV